MACLEDVIVSRVHSQRLLSTPERLGRRRKNMNLKGGYSEDLPIEVVGNSILKTITLRAAIDHSAATL